MKHLLITLCALGALLHAACDPEQTSCTTDSDCFRGEVCAGGVCANRGAPGDMEADQAQQPDLPQVEDMAQDMVTPACAPGTRRCEDGRCIPCSAGAQTFSCEQEERCSIISCAPGYTLDVTTKRCLTQPPAEVIWVDRYILSAALAFDHEQRPHVAVRFTTQQDPLGSQLKLFRWEPAEGGWRESAPVEARDLISMTTDAAGRVHALSFAPTDDLMHHLYERGGWQQQALPIRTLDARPVALPSGDVLLFYVEGERAVRAARWSAQTQSWGQAGPTLWSAPADHAIYELRALCDGARGCVIALGVVPKPEAAVQRYALQLLSTSAAAPELTPWDELLRYGADDGLDNFSSIMLAGGVSALAHLGFVAQDSEQQRSLLHQPITSVSAPGALNAGPQVGLANLMGVVALGSDQTLRAVGTEDFEFFSRDPLAQGWPQQGLVLEGNVEPYNVAHDGDDWWFLHTVNSTEDGTKQVLRMKQIE